MNTPRLIAFYLPQYYPTETNNRFYGEGFTEWTNVTRAKPFFPGHYQPRTPADLGFYDLRSAETREKQAELARNAGIEGFCYYHYWFKKGHRELEVPFQEVVRLKKPDFPFCLCWANQSWYAKFWSKENTIRKPIAEQCYLGKDDNLAHFLTLKEAFQDPRYITVDGKLLFMIYRPLEFPGDTLSAFMEQWKKLAKEYGLPGFYFIGQATSDVEVNRYFSLGLDGVNIVKMNEYMKHFPYSWKGYLFYSKFRRIIKFIYSSLVGINKATGNPDYSLADYVEYKDICKYMTGGGDNTNIFPTMVPNWDHSPRSGRRATIFHHSTPGLFEKHAKEILAEIKNRNPQKQIAFIKSWNEWGEGNYLEPDLRFGHGYLDALHNAVRDYEP